MRYYFELRKDKINLNGLIPMRLIVKNGNHRIRKNLATKTLLDDWNNELQIIINHKGNPFYEDYEIFNEIIASEKKKVEKIFSFFKYNELSFTETLFNEKYEGDDVKVAIGFFDAFDEYIRVSRLTKTKGTITKYGSVKNFLIAFEKYTKFELRLDNIDYQFEEIFMDYCYNERQTLNNYYAKIVKTLKAFLNWAFERGYHSSLKFKKLAAKEDEIEVVYLTAEELMLLYNHKFDNASMERAKDMYCLLALTGQRHSDIYDLNDVSVSGDYLTFAVKKSKTVQHQVFLTELAKRLIAKYEGTIYYPIPRISSQKLNEAIQKCCEEIGLTEEVQLTRYCGSKRFDETFRKCDIITSHTGRKTFITNSLFLDIPERIVKAQTNSKDEKSFRRYVKISEQHHKRELDKWNVLAIDDNKN